MWSRLRNHYKQEFIQILNSKDSKRLNEYLSDMPNNGAGFGCYYRTEVLAETCPEDSKQAHIEWILDTIYGFSEALGLFPEKCIGWEVYWSFLNKDFDVNSRNHSISILLQNIESTINVLLRTPEVCSGKLGIYYNNGIITGRANFAAYAAWLTNKILTNYCLKKAKICEIGPGVGLLSYFLNSFNMKNVTLVDLPEMNAIQAFYLSQALPEAEITLYGEELSFESETIKILPDFYFLSNVNASFDIIINQDSMPEINKEVVNLYLHKIAQVATFYLSINQEMFTTNMNENINQTFYKTVDNKLFLTTMELKERNKSWLRPGYVEQLFKNKSK